MIRDATIQQIGLCFLVEDERGVDQRDCDVATKEKENKPKNMDMQHLSRTIRWRDSVRPINLLIASSLAEQKLYHHDKFDPDM